MFLLGAWVGCIVGVLVVALCQAAGRAKEHIVRTKGDAAG